MATHRVERMSLERFKDELRVELLKLWSERIVDFYLTPGNDEFLLDCWRDGMSPEDSAKFISSIQGA